LAKQYTAMHPFLRIGQTQRASSRLHFVIRDDLNDYLDRCASSGHIQRHDSVTPNVRRLAAARQTIVSCFQGAAGNKREDGSSDDIPADFARKIAEFIFNKTRFLATAMPADSDRNRLFELLNNRGVQLQHHELLKARLLE